MERSDLKVLPLAVVGLAVGVAEVFVKPAAVSVLKKIGELAAQPLETPVQAASITFYTTGSDHEQV